MDVEVRHRDGVIHRHRALFVVGADGAHSLVRGLLGLSFSGQVGVDSMMLADVQLAQTPPDALFGNAAPEAFATVISFGDSWYRIIARNPDHVVPDDAPIDLAEIAETTRKKAVGTDFGMHSPRWMSRFRADELQAPRYRTGRGFWWAMPHTCTPRPVGRG